jgi:hypothetical protein
MIAVRLYSPAELKKKLDLYKCRKVSDLGNGLELWETGWGAGFTLMSEGGRYDEWQFRELVATVIASTMPDDWNDG